MGYEHREDAVRGGRNRQFQTHTHKHTHSVPRDTNGGWSFRQGSETILTHAGVAPLLTILLGYEHWEDEAGGGRSM